MDELFIAEIKLRLANKLSVAYEDVAAAVQEKAGHLGKDSHKVYLRSMTRVHNDTQGEKQAILVKQMKIEKHELRTENAKLRAQLDAQAKMFEQMKKT